MDFIRADRRGEKWEKRHICGCVLSSYGHILPLRLKEFVRVFLPCWLYKGNKNECLPGFTARLEPLCYSVSVANLEGTRIGIVKRIMYAVFPPVSLREALCCVNLPVAGVH